MAPITWTPKAQNDLQATYLYIARDSRPLAEAFTLRLIVAVEQLTSFPRSGRVVPEFDRPDIRELVVQKYRIVYRVREQAVEVLTIQHGARALGSDAVPPD